MENVESDIDDITVGFIIVNPSCPVHFRKMYRNKN